jgi:hypothetical protein
MGDILRWFFTPLRETDCGISGRPPGCVRSMCPPAFKSLLPCRGRYFSVSPQRSNQEKAPHCLGHPFLLSTSGAAALENRPARGGCETPPLAKARERRTVLALYPRAGRTSQQDKGVGGSQPRAFRPLAPPPRAQRTRVSGARARVRNRNVSSQAQPPDYEHDHEHDLEAAVGTPSPLSIRRRVWSLQGVGSRGLTDVLERSERRSSAGTLKRAGSEGTRSFEERSGAIVGAPSLGYFSVARQRSNAPGRGAVA